MNNNEHSLQMAVDHIGKLDIQKDSIIVIYYDEITGPQAVLPFVENIEKELSGKGMMNIIMFLPSSMDLQAIPKQAIIDLYNKIQEQNETGQNDTVLPTA